MYGVVFDRIWPEETHLIYNWLWFDFLAIISILRILVKKRKNTNKLFGNDASFLSS